MSIIRKGLPGRFPKGLQIVPIKDQKFRVALSAGFAQIECDFTRDEVTKMFSDMSNVVKMLEMTNYNHAPTKENINIEDEEARA